MRLLNRWLEKLMPVMIPISLVIGIIFSDTFIFLQPMIPWLFAVMTFGGSLNSNFRAFGQAIAHPRPIFFVLVIAHFVMPLLAWTLSKLIFPGDTYTLTGFVLAMAIPTGVTSFIWTVIKKGDASLSLAIILVSAMLTPLMVPFTVSLLIGASVHIDGLDLMLGLFYMILLPSIIAMTLHEWTKGKIVHTVGFVLKPITKIGMAFIVLLNGAVVAPYLQNVGFKIIPIAGVSLFLAIIGYCIAYFFTKYMKVPYAQQVSITYATGMRNIAAGATLAITYFPPPVAIPVISGMLFQQLTAALMAKYLFK